MGIERLIFKLICKLWPVPADDEAAEPLTAAESSRFVLWEGAIGLALVGLIAPVFGVAWYATLTRVAALCYPDPPGTLRLYSAPRTIWMLPAGFLGLMTSAIPMVWIVRWIMGDQAERYFRSCDQRHGYRGEPARRSIFLGALVVALILLLLGIRQFVRLGAAEIEIGRPFALQHQWETYGTIRAIEHRLTLIAPSGSVVHRPHYVIKFAAGPPLYLDGNYSLDAAGLDELARWIAGQAGRPITECP